MYIFDNPSICKQANRITFKLIRIGIAEVDNEWSGYVHCPVMSRLYYIISGSCRIKTANSEITLMPGNWYLFPAGFSFGYNCEDQMEHIFFHFKLCDYDETDLLRNYNSIAQLPYPENNMACLLPLLEANSIFNSLFLKQTAYSVLLTMIKKCNVPIKAGDYSPCILKAIQYIKEHLSAQLTIPEIAENVYVSKSTLTKHFQKELSMSINKYIYNTILFEASQLLIRTNDSVLSISERFGFSDQFYFSRKFKEYFGQSPREYRKNLQG